MDELFNWQSLASCAGAATATTLITQFIKGIFDKIPTQIVSYFTALFILVCATAATMTSFIWQNWAIVPLNAVVVSLCANGAYSAAERVNRK